jgi:hypothetical protein
VVPPVVYDDSRAAVWEHVVMREGGQMKMKIGRGLLGLLGVAALAACASSPPASMAPAAGSADASKAPASADESKAPADAIPGNARRVVRNGTEYFCVSETITGSRVQTAELCRTREQWITTAQNARDTVYRLQQQGTQTVPSAGPGDRRSPAAQ